MNPYGNEDVMWQRLQDLQREAENRRLLGDPSPSWVDTLRFLAGRAWLLGGMAMRRAPRPSAAAVPSSRRIAG